MDSDSRPLDRNPGAPRPDDASGAPVTDGSGMTAPRPKPDLNQPERTLLTTSRFRVVEKSLGEGRPSKEIVRHPGSVCIVPVLNDGRICLIQNYRPSIEQTLIEAPAGTIEPPEPPEHCARRELQEETGYVGAQWTKLGELFLAPGLLDERAHVYLAEQLSPGPQQLEADELIETFPVTWDELQRLLEKKAIQDAKTLAAISLWRRHLGEN